mmetsp:Transcript_56662/g.104900  ORF Transcript_56662/g.104900 Transcript_56662/m.104900 type:complete len:770 (-) Transcript_56662:31-2340(-)
MRQQGVVISSLSHDIGWIGGAFAACMLAVALAAVVKEGSDRSGTPVELKFVELPWLNDSNTITVMAATFFSIQTAVAFSTLALVSYWYEFSKDAWSQRFLQSIWAHSFVSVVGAVIYGVVALSRFHVVARHPEHGDHLILRNVEWMLVTPLQWFTYAHVCTTAELRHVLRLCIPATGVHLFSIAMLVCGSPLVRKGLLISSCACFVVTFHMVAALPRVPEMARLARHVIQVAFLLWLLYPMAYFLRVTGHVSQWTEQVACYTILDVATKGVTFTSILVARFAQYLSNISGSLQIVLSSHDLTLVVDEAFRIVSGPQSVPVVAHYLDHLSGKDSLLEMCRSPEHAARLAEAARVADAQPFGATAITPKCMVAFSLPTGQTLETECMLSKSNNGNRVICITVKGLVEEEQDIQDLADVDDLSTIRSFGTDARSVAKRNDNPQAGLATATASTPWRAPREADMQVTMSIHNCCQFLNLDGRMQQSLHTLFTQMHVLCALSIWDSTTGVLGQANVVAMSLLLRQLCFEKAEMPILLEHMVDKETLSYMGKPLTSDIIMYQRQRVQLPNGILCNMTVMPLNWLAGQSEAESDIRLHVLVLELPTISCNNTQASAGTKKKSAAAEQSFWYWTGPTLTCIQSDAHISPPVPLLGLQQPDSPFKGWHLFFKLPFPDHPGDQDKVEIKEGDLMECLVLARPASQIKEGFTSSELFPGSSQQELIKMLSGMSREDAKGPIPEPLVPILKAASDCCMIHSSMWFHSVLKRHDSSPLGTDC